MINERIGFPYKIVHDQTLQGIYCALHGKLFSSPREFQLKPTIPASIEIFRLTRHCATYEGTHFIFA